MMMTGSTTTMDTFLNRFRLFDSIAPLLGGICSDLIKTVPFCVLVNARETNTHHHLSTGNNSITTQSYRIVSHRSDYSIQNVAQLKPKTNRTTRSLWFVKDHSAHKQHHQHHFALSMRYSVATSCVDNGISRDRVFVKSQNQARMWTAQEEKQLEEPNTNLEPVFFGSTKSKLIPTSRG